MKLALSAADKKISGRRGGGDAESGYLLRLCASVSQQCEPPRLIMKRSHSTKRFKINLQIWAHLEESVVKGKWGDCCGGLSRRERSEGEL